MGIVVPWWSLVPDDVVPVRLVDGSERHTVYHRKTPVLINMDEMTEKARVSAEVVQVEEPCVSHFQSDLSLRPPDLGAARVPRLVPVNRGSVGRRQRTGGGPAHAMRTAVRAAAAAALGIRRVVTSMVWQACATQSCRRSVDRRS